jgi:hypothetical protein
MVRALLKEGVVMDKRKMKIVVLGFISVLFAGSCLLGSVTQARAETMKCRVAITETKDMSLPVGAQEGHVLGVHVLEGLAFFENGEIAKVKVESLYENETGKTAQAIGYDTFTFEDGSTIVARFQRLAVSDKNGNLSAKASTELVKGTGRFEGVKGTASATGKNFPPGKDEVLKAMNDLTFTYTLPGK